MLSNDEIGSSVCAGVNGSAPGLPAARSCPLPVAAFYES